ncbi:rab-GTPase-TBC domain-containing protein [Sporodiniella umbellata]|nr:rab-GTPase-TBC domain-containing protein [Sporodiniella umbellata]
MKRKERSKKKQIKRKQVKLSYAHENQDFQGVFKINQALNTKDYHLLREIGQETGFLTDPIRRRVWPFLLRVSDKKTKKEGSLDTPHKDEEQVKLDVARSFNSYPKNVGEEEKDRLRAQLHRVIIHVLRSYPSLCYYQGFHDICSVFLLIFGEKRACQMMERVSLFYLRDTMFTTLEPVMRQLTMVDTLIRLKDKELHEFITEAGVLPYYCLSWVITWCSHDIESLENLSRLFDLFLTSNPLILVYFSAVVVLSKKEQVLALPCDTSTVHSFLTKFPTQVDIDLLCDQTVDLIRTYGVYELQCTSTIALDQYSAINRFEADWLSIETTEDLNQAVRRVIRLTREEKHDKPVTLVTTKPDESTHSILKRLLHNKKEMYTIFTLSAAIGIIALWIANSGLIK